MNLPVVNDTIRRSRMRDVRMFRAVPRSEAPGSGAFWPLGRVAVVARLSALGEGIEATGAAGASGLGIPCDTHVVRSPAAGPRASIEISESPARVAYEGLTLRSPRDGRTLIEGPHSLGMRVLIRGRDASAQVALFRATAGIWCAGAGRIVRPGLDEILFLPERPYLPPGTLRELLLLPQQEHAVPDGSDPRHSHGPRPRQGACAGRGARCRAGLGRHPLARRAAAPRRRPQSAPDFIKSTDWNYMLKGVGFDIPHKSILCEALARDGMN